MRGVAPKDEVVAPLRRAGPQMRALKAPRSHPRQIGHNHFVVHPRAHLRGDME